MNPVAAASSTKRAAPSATTRDGVAGHVLRHEIQAITTQIGKARKRLVFQGDGAWTNRDVISLPALDPLAVYDRRDAGTLRALAVHEAAHIRYTDWQATADGRKRAASRAAALGATGRAAAGLRRAYRIISNILDDRHVENKVRRDYPGTSLWLSDLRSDAAEKRHDDWASDGVASRTPAEAFLTALLSACDASNDWSCAPTARRTILAISRRHPQVAAAAATWEARSRGLDDAAAVHRYADEVLDDMLQLVGWPDPPDDDADSDEDDEPATEDETERPSGRTATSPVSRTAEPPSWRRTIGPQGTDTSTAIRRLAEATIAASQRTTDAATAAPLVGMRQATPLVAASLETLERRVADLHEHSEEFTRLCRGAAAHPGFDPSARAEARRAESELGRRIRPLLMAQRACRMRTRLTDGLLDHGNIVGLSIGDPDVFKRRDRAPRTSTAMILLVDQSGSTMLGGLLQLLGRLAWAAAELSLAVPELRTAMLTYTGAGEQGNLVTIVKNFEDSPGAARQSFDAWWRSPKISGGTPAAAATLAAARRLERRRERRRILVTLTDGAPDDLTAADAANRHVAQRGMEACILEIGVGRSARSTCRHAATAVGADDAPAALETLLRGLLAETR